MANLNCLRQFPNHFFNLLMLLKIHDFFGKEPINFKVFRNFIETSELIINTF